MNAMLARLIVACLACGARGYSAPARVGPSRFARSHGAAMGLTLPPMPPMPEGLPRLDGIGSLPSMPEDQPPWAVQMWVDLLDLLRAVDRHGREQRIVDARPLQNLEPNNATNPPTAFGQRPTHLVALLKDFSMERAKSCIQH